MNKLNGGYSMINLDDTSTLKTQLEKAVASGKPIIAYKDGVGNYALVTSATNYYYIYLPNNKMYEFFTISSTLTQRDTLQKKYRHIVSLSTVISGDTHVFAYDVINENSTAYASATKVQAIQALNVNGYVDANSPKLVGDSHSGTALAYVAIEGGSPKMYVKLPTQTTYTGYATSSMNFVGDSVKEF